MGIAISYLYIGSYLMANMLDYCNISELIIINVLLLAFSLNLGILGTLCL